MNATAKFRVHGELGAFLPGGRRDIAFTQTCARAATLKNAIEVIGIPHTEIGQVLVNGSPATLSRAVRDGDSVEAFAWPPGASPVPEGEPRFIADAHLGGLARFLRMLGFDTLHDHHLHDAQVCALAHGERRVVLTRDRGLLMRRDLAFGCFVRAPRVEDQLRYVAARYGLAAIARPFTRCLLCNRLLEPVDKGEIAEQLPERVRAVQDRFTRCRACERIYWPGTHYERMRGVLRALG